MTSVRFSKALLRSSTNAGGNACANVESVLSVAEAFFGKDCGFVWIVNREGEILLPADQAGLRPSSGPASPPDA